jgi:formylglycine-generating enzyme required for sulfatase activity
MLHTTKLINTMTNRQAMGLPVSYKTTILDTSLEEIYRRFATYSLEQLVAIAESLGHVTTERFVAGQLLAQFGDLRINTKNPHMIAIPSAEVTIGLNQEDIDAVLKRYSKVGVIREWIEKEVPAFKTNLKNFKIAKYLVTNQEYRDFLIDTNYEELPTSWEFGIYSSYKANHPVYTITTSAAEAYAKWLSEKTGRCFRLPTEYEWEYAASGMEHYEYPWGNSEFDDAANTLEEGVYSSSPVGIFPKGNSPFGLTDMAGNVEEYVATDYHAYPRGKHISDDLSANNSGGYRICRGGSFARYRDMARTTRRHGYYNKDIYVIGFRLAEDY